MLIKNASVYVNAKRCFEKKDILIVDGIISNIGQIDFADTEIFDAATKSLEEKDRMQESNLQALARSEIAREDGYFKRYGKLYGRR